MRIGDAAGAVGKGLVAGAVGTAVMTLASTIETKLQGREESTAPAEAAEKVLGVTPENEEKEALFSNLVHWGYGTGWGAVRGVMSVVGLRGPLATMAHFASVWGASLRMLPALGIAPPAKTWGSKELAVDGAHHAVYAIATGLTYRFLERHSAEGAGR